MSSIKWGQGSAPLLEPNTTGETESLISFSDWHVPYANDALVESALRMIRKLKPDNVLINGDLWDFFELSRFCVDTERQDQVQSDIDQGNVLQARIRKAAPNARLIFNEGNHENRILSYLLKNAPALKSIRSLDRQELFDYKKNEVQWFSGAGFRIRPHFLLKHGTIVRGEAGATAKAEHTTSGLSGISGHTHRLAPYVKEGYEKRVWWEQGCMCQLECDYVVGRPNWTNGGVVAQFSTSTSSFLVEPIQAQNDKLVYGGVGY